VHTSSSPGRRIGTLLAFRPTAEIPHGDISAKAGVFLTSCPTILDR
jgi:hypothetical protein